MSYVFAFVTPVPSANKEAYLSAARAAAVLFKEWGATRCVETWADDVPAGKQTDFMKAVAAKPDEVVVFSWIEFPDKATRTAAGQKMRTDPRMQEIQMPFDGARMIYGGFETILDV